MHFTLKHSLTSVWLSLFLDGTPPVVTFSQPPALTNDVALIKWTSNENAVFHCSLDNGAYVDCGEGISSQWIGAALEDGEHTLKVRGTDDAGNIARPKPWTWKAGKKNPQHPKPGCSLTGKI
jgi:hypothetical protein